VPSSDRRGFRGLSEVDGLSDRRARDLVLGNWHKLNVVLRTRLSAFDIRRLLALEVSMGHAARPNFVERLRAALHRAESRESRAAAKRVCSALRRGGRLARTDLRDMGLDEDDVRRLGR
jgi:hypothetical protein